MRVTQIGVFSLVLAAGFAVSAGDFESIVLTPPRVEGGRPLMQALKERKTIREFSPEKLPVPVLSDLLWAGFGVNRAASGNRTAPSAMNSQEIDIYVAMSDGLFVYDAKAHQLKPVLRADVRRQIGSQAFLRDAPISLIFVADFSRAEKMKVSDRDFYSAIDTGCISQNIYLFCASEGLATVVHELSNRPALAQAMALRSEQKIILSQAVGFPKPAEGR